MTMLMKNAMKTCDALYEQLAGEFMVRERAINNAAALVRHFQTLPEFCYTSNTGL